LKIKIDLWKNRGIKLGSTDGMTLRAVDLHRPTIQPPIAALATTGNFIVGRILLA